MNPLEMLMSRIGGGMQQAARNAQYAMPEDLRNYVGTSKWDIGRGNDVFANHDTRLADSFDGMMDQDLGGGMGLVGMAKRVDLKKMYPGWGGSLIKHGDADIKVDPDGTHTVNFPERGHYVGQLNAPTTTFNVKDAYDNLSRKVFNVDDLKDSAAILLNGDKTPASGQLTSINGKTLENPVDFQGGPRYAEENPDYAWASAPGVISTYKDQIERAAQKAPNGKVYGIYANMGGDSSDFATMSTDAFSELLRQLKVKKKDLGAFDKWFSEQVSGSKNFKDDWVGLSNIDDAKAQLREMPGILRSKFMKEAAKKEWSGRGFPDVPSIRTALSEPELLNNPVGQAGFSVVRLDPERAFISNPNHVHDTYSTAMGGTPEGQFPQQLDWKHVFPTVVESITQQHPHMADKGDLWGPMNRHAKDDERFQVYTPEVLDQLKKYLGLK